MGPVCDGINIFVSLCHCLCSSSEAHSALLLFWLGFLGGGSKVQESLSSSMNSFNSSSHSGLYLKATCFSSFYRQTSSYRQLPHLVDSHLPSHFYIFLSPSTLCFIITKWKKSMN